MKKVPYSDRFVPLRSNWETTNVAFAIDFNSRNGSAYVDKLRQAMFPDNPRRVLQYSSRGLSSFEQNSSRITGHRVVRSPTPLILDLPDFVDDFYSNRLHWSCNDLVTVACGQSVYLFDVSLVLSPILFCLSIKQHSYCYSTQTTTQGSAFKLENKLEEYEFPYALQFSSQGNFLAVGTSFARVQLWDPAVGKLVREISGNHSNAIGAISWTPDGSFLTTGSKDSFVFNYDPRLRHPLVSIYHNHDSAVCGLTWHSSSALLGNFEFLRLVFCILLGLMHSASGGNDNLVNIWDRRADRTPRHEFSDHTAAVRALAWCPWQNNLLVTGGGSADKRLFFWDTSKPSGLCKTKTIETGGQVCSVVWSLHLRELASAHGLDDCNVCVWDYDSEIKIADLQGHTNRVLNLAISPDGETVCSAGDESLRFWSIFEPNPENETERWANLKFAGRPHQRKSAGRAATLRAVPYRLPRNGFVGKAPLSSHSKLFPAGLLR